MWVKALGALIPLLNDRNARSIAQRVGKVLDMTPTHKNGVLTNYFMRFKMETSLNKPHLEGFFLKSEWWNLIWVQMKYERLPVFCYKCGMVGHKEQYCVSPGVGEIFHQPMKY